MQRKDLAVHLITALRVTSSPRLQESVSAGTGTDSGRKYSYLEQGKTTANETVHGSLPRDRPRDAMLRRLEGQRATRYSFAQ